MPLIPTERSLCNKVVADFGGLTAPIRAAKGLIRSTASQFEDQLRNTIFSSTSEIDDALTQLENDVAENLPGDTVSDVQAIKDFLDNCEYLSGLNPVSAVAGTVLGVYDAIEDTINGLSNTTPEFTLGGIGDIINKALRGLQFPFGDNISELFAKADKLIDCLTAFCDGYLPQADIFSDDLNELYTDMNIVNDPNDSNYTNFDFGSIYTNVGISPTQISNVDRVLDGITQENIRGKEAINSSIEAVKDAIRIKGIGGF